MRELVIKQLTKLMEALHHFGPTRRGEELSWPMVVLGLVIALLIGLYLYFLSGQK